MSFRIIIFLTLLSSCELYRSTSRKEFETKAPNYVRAQSLETCFEVTEEMIQKGFAEEFLSRVVWANEKFLVAEDKVNTYWIQTWNQETDEICHFYFKNQEDWLDKKSDFLNKLK